MPFNLSGRLVFLASPGNMAHERQLCRKVIQEVNEEQIETARVSFIVRAWEDMPGGVGRPQDRINPKLDDCDFMVLILGDRWGSPPALDGPYSSGTEEEFYRCLDLLAQPEADMRDLLILFKTLDPERLRDPGPQLLEVMNFRDSVEKSKKIHYVSFDSEESFATAVRRKLIEWAAPLGVRTPTRIALPTTEASIEPPARATREQLLETARGHADNGLLMQAEAAFSHAVEDGNVEAISQFALFMRRTGRLERALELNRQIIEDPKLLSSTDRESVAHRVSALANMGVIYRKRGSLSDSIRILREAVRTAEVSAVPVYRELCYALDNYGLSVLRNGNAEVALLQFEKAHALRTEFGSSRDLAQSSINLGRRMLLLKDFEQAGRLFAEVLEIPDAESDNHLFANALCGLAEARLSQGFREGVQDLLDQALVLNDGLGNSDGVSIAHALLAKLNLLKGEYRSAAMHADLCRQESEKTNSAIGLGTAAFLLAAVAVKDGRSREAHEYLTQAVHYARQSGSDSLIRDIDVIASELAGSSFSE
ncbi:DUF4062 domain-containing protein [Saccharomonospora azurea]|uniref:DUF4062 domain-containing protein n=1 Tax=Saccharomonospora azurea TaxID=40988 RepID=UPI003D940B37